MSSKCQPLYLPKLFPGVPNYANRMALGMWLEKLSLSEVEIKRKASIVPDDGVNLLFLNKKSGFFVSTKIPQFFHSRYEKQTTAEDNVRKIAHILKDKA